jgi:predicted membrane channel-forming protein YqfA (hemolysin III family)
MKKICQYTYMVGGVLLVVGAALYITKWAGAPYLYLLGAFMFGAMQMLDRYTGKSFILRRLRRQQLLGAVALMLTGVLMLSCKHNEWILCLLVGCIFELYTAFRIPQELEKEQ